MEESVFFSGAESGMFLVKRCCKNKEEKNPTYDIVEYDKKVNIQSSYVKVMTSVGLAFVINR